MKITNVRLRQVQGELDSAGDIWEERLVRPIDIYPEHKAETGVNFHQSRNSRGLYDVNAVFVYIETDEGVTGFFGPMAEEDAYFIDTQITPFILGEDPTATERLWDKMYRFLIHGRKGHPMFAISSIDCALWDLRGKWLGQPLFRLLGGPVRDSIPAYASALGYSIESERGTAQVRAFVDQGYTATKWFFRHAPDDGEPGIRGNMQLVGDVREAAGDEVDIMFDAWNSWNVRYALDMANRMAEFRPRWLEEPVMPDQIGNYARIRAASPIPISGGEHEYTRWGARLRAGWSGRYFSAGYMLGGRSQRSCKNLRSCLRLRRSGNSPRPFSASKRPFGARRPPDCYSVDRIPGEMERSPPILLQAPRNARRWTDPRDRSTRHRDRDRREQGSGRKRTLVDIGVAEFRKVAFRWGFNA